MATYHHAHTRTLSVCLSFYTPNKYLLLVYDPPTMLLSLHRSISAIWILGLISCFCSAAQPVCWINPYGLPVYSDCFKASLEMPFAQEPEGSHNIRPYELFSEPQYLLPPFKRVYNAHKPRPINQLPKIWRYSMLMPVSHRSLYIVVSCS